VDQRWAGVGRTNDTRSRLVRFDFGDVSNAWKLNGTYIGQSGTCIHCDKMDDVYLMLILTGAGLGASMLVLAIIAIIIDNISLNSLLRLLNGKMPIAAPETQLVVSTVVVVVVDASPLPASEEPCVDDVTM
jgi:hypothetical protein